jgi:transcriptional regulator with XRE-family HTH domain
MKEIGKNTITNNKDNDLGVNLRAQIKSRIENMAINIRALERKAGLSVGTLNNIINGASANPTAETLNALANVFECSVDELLNRPKKVVTEQQNNNTLKALESFQWNPSLFNSIIHELNNQILAKKTPLNAGKALYISEEVYLYCLKKQKNDVDSSLIEWLLDKSL